MLNDYKYYLEKIGEYGEVTQVRESIAQVSGLPSAKPHEVVFFENGEIGSVFSINENSISVMRFAKGQIKIGSKLTRTDEYLSIWVGYELLGSLVDPFGNFILTRVSKKPKTKNRLLAEFLGIEKRLKVKKPFITGVSLVDMLVPLGKGQKELVIGDRKTGKTSFLLTTVKNQVKEGTIIIYAAIGKKIDEVKKLLAFFEKEILMKNIIVVAATSTESPSLIYLAPYSAMTMAEFFRDEGRDVLLVLDDLSSHAKFYREMSLLDRRFPGRESYPGDIFFSHAKLIERAGNFIHPQKREVSITCLPVVETVESDLTGYVPTNIMSMTDGHIFFDNNIYIKGRRPAINVFLSVTRVGKQVQSTLKRELNQKLISFFSSYERLENLAHFGSELSGGVKKTLDTGEKFLAFFEQNYHLVVPEEVNLLMFALIWLDLIVEREKVLKIKEKLINFAQKPAGLNYLKKITEVDSLEKFLLKINKNKEEILKLCPI